MSSHPSQQIVVIGLGHEAWGDDAVGPCVSRQLAGQPGIQTRETAGKDGALVRSWAGADVVILIDAFECGGLPGAILRLESHGGELPARLVRYSRHAADLREAEAWAGAHRQPPPRMVVFGIEGGDFRPGRALSAAVAEAARLVIHRVRREIQTIKRRFLHELALIKDLLKVIDRIAAEQYPARVVGVSVCLGALSHISPAHFREHFTDVTRGTHLDGLHLEIEMLADGNAHYAEDIVLDTVELEE